MRRWYRGSNHAWWISFLSLFLLLVCYFNENMLMHYHPGMFLKGHWSCCQSNNKVAIGCQPTFHLLTRSSSRYADMRRRDTLLRRPRRKKNHLTCSLSTLAAPHVTNRGHIGSWTSRSNSCSQLAAVACDTPMTIQELLLGTNEVSPAPQSIASFSLTTVAVCEAAATAPQECELEPPPLSLTTPMTSDDKEIQEDSTSTQEKKGLVSLSCKPTIQPRISDCNPDVIHV